MTSFSLGSLLNHADLPDAVWDTIIPKYGSRYAKDLTDNQFLGSRVRALCALHTTPSAVLDSAIRAGNHTALDMFLADTTLPETIAHTAVLYWTFNEPDQLRLCDRTLSTSWTSVLLVGVCQPALDVLRHHNPDTVNVGAIPQEAPLETTHCSARALADLRRRALTARMLTKGMSLATMPAVWQKDVEAYAAIGYVLANEMGDATSADSKATWVAFLSLMDSGVIADFDELVGASRALCAD
jgi:hypothetical protein